MFEGKAEPIEEPCFPEIQVIFFEPVARTLGSYPKEIVMSDPNRRRYLLGVFRSSLLDLRRRGWAAGK